jgi:SAM-dependent methyltransferase
MMTGNYDRQMNGNGFLVEAFHKCWHRMSARFRKKREQQFLRLFPPEKFPSLIDIGGLATQWKDDPRDITILNVMPQSAAHCRVIVGDGRNTGLPDSFFDIAYSNSAIEHVGGWEDQMALACELRRIGRAIYCQTPNRWFPLEVHYQTFFLHWHPRILRNHFVARFLTGWGWLVRPSRQRVKEYASQVRLLTPAEMKQLFPDCVIQSEKFLGMTKSLIAIRLALPL